MPKLEPEVAMDKGHSLMFRCGEGIALGKVVDFINARLDQHGVANDYNVGYRTAMRDVTGEILSLLRSLNNV